MSGSSQVFVFRALTHADLPLVHEWLNRPHIAQWWEGEVSLEHVAQTLGADIGSATITPLLACLKGTPIGYAQSYRVLGADPEWWTEETDPGARGIDLFLANAEQLNRGLGSQMARDLVALLFADPEVTIVQADPAPNNARALRAYEKAGFRPVAEVTTPDGPARLMVVTRADLSPAMVGRKG